MPRYYAGRLLLPPWEVFPGLSLPSLIDSLSQLSFSAANPSIAAFRYIPLSIKLSISITIKIKGQKTDRCPQIKSNGRYLMEITAAQLRAIEDAIGRDAKVKVVLADHISSHRCETLFEVEAIHKGRKVCSRLAISPYTETPMEFVAERLVRQMNKYIMDEEFRRVNW